MSGRRVVVTGGGGGLGSAIAQALARQGDEVVVADRDLARAEEVARSIAESGDRAVAVQVDVTRSDSWADLVRAADDRVDVLVNAAGVIARVTLETLDARSWSDVMSVNVLGASLGIQAVIPGMKAAGAGVVVNIGSTAALQAHSDPVYCTSKWALRGLSKAAAVELAPFGIRVGCVHPGLVPTELTSSAEHYVAAALHASPLGRLADGRAIAEAVSYLAGASAVTGVDLEVDGGYTVGGAVWARRQFTRAQEA